MKEKNKTYLEIAGTLLQNHYDQQELRKKAMNRLRNIVFRKITGLDWRELQEKTTKTDEEKKYLKEYADNKLWAKLTEITQDKDLDEKEREYLKRVLDCFKQSIKEEENSMGVVASMVREEEVYDFFTQHIKGLGDKTTAVLLHYFGYCEGVRHPSSLMSYAGLTPDSKYVKGESCKFNPKLRMFMWRIGDSFIKQRTPRYRDFYDVWKEEYLARFEKEGYAERKGLGVVKSKLHADLMARRKMMKKFLIDYYVVCKYLTGEPASLPYVVGRGGHEVYDDVLVYLEELKKTKLKNQ